MKRIIIVALLLFAAGKFSFAQVTENFNTRPSAETTGQIKSYLQDRCWVLQGLDINHLGGALDIEGDGSLVLPLGSSEQTGLYTPLLQVPGNMYLSFSYAFSGNVTAGHLLKIALTDYNNNIYTVLDNVDLSGKNGNTVYNYANYFNNLPSGAFRVFVSFIDQDQTTLMVLDQLLINIPTLYNGGCNQAPVATNDNFTGLDNHTAHGYLTLNDYDPNSEFFTAYLVANSPDGNVVINGDGSFDFAPNAGFEGTTTSFTYQVCDNGFGPLCSNIALVTINFPGAAVPMRLINFSASIDDERNVNIRWTTTFEQGTSKFEIERSLDGSEFKKIADVSSAGNSQIKRDYSYDDRLRNSVLNKNDVFYRMRLVKRDGKIELSKVLVIRLVNTATTKTIAVTHNPAKNDINVQVQLRENSYVVMKVTDSKGVEVARKSIKGGTGLNSFMMEGTSRLTPGIYMLEVIVNSSERMITRLVKN